MIDVWFAFYSNTKKSLNGLISILKEKDIPLRDKSPIEKHNRGFKFSLYLNLRKGTDRISYIVAQIPDTIKWYIEVLDTEGKYFVNTDTSFELLTIQYIIHYKRNDGSCTYFFKSLEDIRDGGLAKMFTDQKVGKLKKNLEYTEKSLEQYLTSKGMEFYKAQPTIDIPEYVEPYCEPLGEPQTNEISIGDTIGFEIDYERYRGTVVDIVEAELGTLYITDAGDSQHYYALLKVPKGENTDV